MPVHVENFDLSATVSSGDLPLSEAQIETLVQIVLNRLQMKLRDQERRRAATSLLPGFSDHDPGYGGM
jgi:hypothetical protein